MAPFCSSVSPPHRHLTSTSRTLTGSSARLSDPPCQCRACSTARPRQPSLATLLSPTCAYPSGVNAWFLRDGASGSENHGSSRWHFHELRCGSFLHASLLSPLRPRLCLWSRFLLVSTSPPVVLYETILNPGTYGFGTTDGTTFTTTSPSSFSSSPSFGRCANSAISVSNRSSCVLVTLTSISSDTISRSISSINRNSPSSVFDFPVIWWLPTKSRFICCQSFSIRIHFFLTSFKSYPIQMSQNRILEPQRQFCVSNILSWMSHILYSDLTGTHTFRKIHSGRRWNMTCLAGQLWSIDIPMSHPPVMYTCQTWYPHAQSNPILKHIPACSYLYTSSTVPLASLALGSPRPYDRDMDTHSQLFIISSRHHHHSNWLPTFVRIIKVHRIQSNHCHMSRNNFNRIIGPTLKHLALSKGHKWAPDAVVDRSSLESIKKRFIRLRCKTLSDTVRS